MSLRQHQIFANLSDTLTQECKKNVSTMSDLTKNRSTTSCIAVQRSSSSYSFRTQNRPMPKHLQRIDLGFPEAANLASYFDGEEQRSFFKSLHPDLERCDVGSELNRFRPLLEAIRKQLPDIVRDQSSYWFPMLIYRRASKLGAYTDQKYEQSCGPRQAN
jgi:hypothetical protein